jgi:hypothetical protein
VIILRVLTLRPTVEGFVHHKHAETIAGVEKRRRDRVVAGPYRIVAVALEDLNAPLLRTIDRHATEWSVVVVDTAAVHLCLYSIQDETIGRVERDVAQPERDQQCIL